jgi:hypothetical protein
MSTQPKKNLTRKFISIAGVASATVALSFPAFALTNTDASHSNQFFNNQISRTDSTLSNKNLLAQGSGSDPSNNNTTGGSSTTNQSPSTGGSNTNQRSTTGGVNNTDQPSTTNRSSQVGNTSTMDENGTMNRRLVTGGDSVRGVIFRCLNNPNPNCDSQ